MTVAENETSAGEATKTAAATDEKGAFNWKKVSVIAGALVAATGAAVTVKDNVWTMLGWQKASSLSSPEHDSPVKEAPPPATTEAPDTSDSTTDSQPTFRHSSRRTDQTRRGGATVTRTTENSFECSASSQECARLLILLNRNLQYAQQVQGAPPEGAVIGSEPPAGPLMVFFDWDSDEIAPPAAAILDEAARAYETTGARRVLIAGHTDRSGPADYNSGLSRRRASSVEDYLQRRGVPQDAILSQGFGESRPLVGTADGIRDPQNRRVEISFVPAPAADAP